MKKSMRWMMVILAAVPSAGVLSGCDKFLDVKPTGVVIPDTEEQYRATLVNAYNRFPRDLGKLILRGDLARLNEQNTTGMESHQYLYTWQDSEQPATASTCQWKDYYYAIYIANYLIENVGNAPEMVNPGFQQLVGEAYLLRAYAHFLLVNIYAPPYSIENAGLLAVPLSMSTATDRELARSTVGQVYAQVKRDVEEGLRLCTVEKWTVPEYRYRFSVDAARAFQCRLALYMGEWDGVIAAGDPLLKNGHYSLVDLTASTAVLPCLYKSTEAIMALDYPLDDEMLTLVLPSEACVAMYNQKDDRRFRATFKEPILGTYVVNRGTAGESSAYRSTFRLGEVYLNMAEAYARKGDVEMARNLLLFLQDKRLRNPHKSTQADEIKAMTGEELLSYLMDERARELAFEGHRWFDLRRMGQPSLTHVLGGRSYTLNAGDARYTLPIPREAIDNNGSLVGSGQ